MCTIRTAYVNTNECIIHQIEWRSFHNELRTSPQRNTIDGDLVERILEMDRTAVEVLAMEVGR